jgi:hypothetical protein
MFMSWGHSSSSAFRICIKIVTTAGLVRGVGGGGAQGSTPDRRRDDTLKVHKREKFFGSDFQLFTIL